MSPEERAREIAHRAEWIYHFATDLPTQQALDAISSAIAQASAEERQACWERAMAAMGAETEASRRRVSAAIREKAKP